jgi:magnesium-transporting ATPase (P-type)
MWKEDENVERCPDCDVGLVPLHQMPPSAETLLEQEAELNQTPPEWRKRSFFDLGRGRGLLIGLALIGLAGFFQPWFILKKPEIVILSGFRIARFFAGWVWAGAIGWFVLIALLLTRRSIASLRGVRAISVFFASLTLCEILVLANVSPTSKIRVPIEFGWAYGLWWSALVSALGAIVAMGLGGALPPRDDPKSQKAPDSGSRVVRRSHHETLH